MSTAPQRRIPLRRRRGWAWLRLCRPIATLTGAALALTFAFILEGGSPVWHEALRLTLAMAAVLAAASILNDAMDLPVDRDRYIWRALPAGLVTTQQAYRAAAALAVLALVLSLTLDWRAFLLAAAGLALAYVYSARLKATPMSWLPLALAFALLPVWVAESVDRFDDSLWWAIPVGLTGGLAAHLVIKLPDYERDDEEATRNVLHWLTIDFAVPVAWGAVGAYIVVAVASANIENLRVEWIAPAAGAAIFLTLSMMTVLFFGVTEGRLVVQRWLLSACIVAVAVGWLGSIAP